jgi:hypothetical protein
VKSFARQANCFAREEKSFFPRLVREDYDAIRLEIRCQTYLPASDEYCCRPPIQKSSPEGLAHRTYQSNSLEDAR